MASLLDSGLGVLGASIDGIGIGGLSAGSINAWLMAGNPLGEAVGRAGLRFAAMGGELTKGVFVYYGRTATGTPAWVPFQFPMNPSDISEKVSPEYTATKVPGQDFVWYTYNNGGEREISFTLCFWYASIRRGDVLGKINLLKTLCRRQDSGDTVTANAAPSAVYFYYGKMFNGERFIVKDLKIKCFDLFDPLFLLPLRAEVEVTLVEARSLRYERNTAGGSLGASQGNLVRIIRAGF